MIITVGIDHEAIPTSRGEGGYILTRENTYLHLRWECAAQAFKS